MNEMKGPPGNIVFANIATMVFTITVLAMVWYGFVLLFGGWIGGLLGWIPAMMVAVAARILVFLYFELAEDRLRAHGKLAQLVDRVPARQWKWFLLAIMLGPAAVVGLLAAVLDGISKH